MVFTYKSPYIITYHQSIQSIKTPQFLTPTFSNYLSVDLYKEKYIDINDSLTSAENRRAIEEMEAKYQNDKKPAAIELLRKDQEIKEASLDFCC